MIVALDTETTSTNPDNGQILEIGALIEDFDTPIEDLPSFRAVLDWELVYGQPSALSMNSELIEEIDNGSEDLHQPEAVAGSFRRWLEEHDVEYPITVAAKNAAFDIQFLEELEGWSIPIRARTIDPGSIYLQKDESIPPDLGECKRRAGIPNPGVSHSALSDARDVVRLIRANQEQ